MARDAAPLGSGGAFALWAFRSCAAGGAGCCCIVKGFEVLFGERGGRAMGAVIEAVRALSRQARRPLVWGAGEGAPPTHGELSLLAALSAMQAGRAECAERHVTWLIGRRPDRVLMTAVERVAAYFVWRELIVPAPAYAPPPERPARLAPAPEPELGLGPDPTAEPKASPAQRLL